MKKILGLLLTISFFQISINGQISFEKGYFLDNKGVRTECLIKNLDWKNNPSRIEYSLEADAAVQTLTQGMISEFGIYGVGKYIKQTLEIDQSSKYLDRLSDQKEPEFELKEVLLKVLIEGEANLYFYKKGPQERYFFKLPGKDIQQLIFKSYRASLSQVAKNNYFQNQLKSSLLCDDLSSIDWSQIAYSRKALVSIITNYNQCKGTEQVNYTLSKGTQQAFRINIRPGLRQARLKAENERVSTFNTDFGYHATPSIGLEFEMFMPFNKGKWSIIMEPTYQQFNQEKEITYIQTPALSRTTIVSSKYQSIEFPVGVRQYSYLNEQSKLFFNANFLIELLLANSIVSERPDLIDLEMSSSLAFALGIGYQFKKDYSLEIRYYTPRELLSQEIGWSASYQGFSLLLAYSIFDKNRNN